MRITSLCCVQAKTWDPLVDSFGEAGLEKCVRCPYAAPCLCGFFHVLN